MRSEYTVIRAESVAYLVGEVNKYCQEGWHPHGGLVVIKDHTASNGIAPVFYQSMVRESEVDARAFRTKMMESGRARRISVDEFAGGMRRVLREIGEP